MQRNDMEWPWTSNIKQPHKTTWTKCDSKISKQSLPQNKVDSGSEILQTSQVRHAKGSKRKSPHFDTTGGTWWNLMELGRLAKACKSNLSRIMRSAAIHGIRCDPWDPCDPVQRVQRVPWQHPMEVKWQRSFTRRLVGTTSQREQKWDHIDVLDLGGQKGASWCSLRLLHYVAFVDPSRQEQNTY